MRQICHSCGKLLATLGEPDTDHLFSYCTCAGCSRLHTFPLTGAESHACVAGTTTPQQLAVWS